MIIIAIFNFKKQLNNFQELPIGTHLIVQRTFYSHHGIFIGNGKVIHYAGLAEGFKKDTIRLTDLKSFANGSKIFEYHQSYVKLLRGTRYTNDEIVKRAYSRLEENNYNVLWNNCEAFANWCTHNDPISFQTSGTIEVNGRKCNYYQAGGFNLFDIINIFKR